MQYVTRGGIGAGGNEYRVAAVPVSVGDETGETNILPGDVYGRHLGKGSPLGRGEMGDGLVYHVIARDLLQELLLDETEYGLSNAGLHHEAQEEAGDYDDEAREYVGEYSRYWHVREQQLRQRFHLSGDVAEHARKYKQYYCRGQDHTQTSEQRSFQKFLELSSH